MKPHRKKRLYLLLTIVFGMSVAVSLTIYALGQNINLYFTPSQLAATQTNYIDKTLRLGGMVEKGSFKRDAGTLQVHFRLTDYTHTINVQYTGILPALFREGQGVVVQGKLDKSGLFTADQVLAKHDEKYMPPNLPAHTQS